MDVHIMEYSMGMEISKLEAAWMNFIGRILKKVLKLCSNYCTLIKLT